MQSTRKQAHEFYADILSDAEKQNEVVPTMAYLGRHDLFYLLVYLCNRPDIDRDWLFEKCVEVQLSPNGHLDLWAREHYKSTIITFGLGLQDILNDPEVTIGLFSGVRPSATKILEQIKRECEDNDTLKQLYPDVLWMDPRKEAPKWSRDDGLIFKRKGNPKESTVEAHGLIQGMPTGRHFKIRVYDDIIDEENVTNPDMIKKATERWELSLNLGSAQPVAHYEEVDIERYVGTRYHYNDPYATILKRGVAKPRIYPGTVDGTTEGEPVLWTREFMAKKRKAMGPYVFGCQILQDPKADEVQGFKEEWLKFWRPRDWDDMILYLLCDPAGEKKVDNDYTVQWVIGLGHDQNYYVTDGLRDRLNLSERTKSLFKFHRRYHPLGTGYEKYGKDSDIEHIEDQMERKQYRFHITALGGSTPKNDRIRKLIPLFEQGRIYLPERLIYIDREKKQHDLTQEFIDDEYKAFPVAEHDDMLDCLARILHPELNAEFPMEDEDLDDIDLSDKEMDVLAAEEGFFS